MSKKIYIAIILLAGLTFVMCERFPVYYPCDIKAHKIFLVPVSKTEIFKTHLTFGHGYSSNIKVNIVDSMFYIYCPGNEKESKAIFECKVKPLNDSATVIETYRVVRFSILSDKMVEDYYANLSSENYLKLLADNLISHLKKGDKHRQFSQDNKKAYDEWQTTDKHVLDSLDKAYKRRDTTKWH